MRQLRPARDVLDLRRRERVQVDRVALLDRAEEVLVVVDGEVGVVAALHEDAGAADCERLLDLLEDDGLREQVALGAVAGPAVEGTEVAVGDADVRVVDVPVDDERDPAGVGATRSERLRRLADRDELLRLEQLERLGVGDPLAVERLVEDPRDCPSVGTVPLEDCPWVGLSLGPGSCWHHFALDEPEVWDPVELACVSGQLHEREQAGALARAEPVAELLEVTREEPGG